MFDVPFGMSRGHLVRGLFCRPSSHLHIAGYSDAKWDGHPIDRRSISRYCTLVGGNLITWHSQKQTVVARSSVEIEYQVMAHIACELI